MNLLKSLAGAIKRQEPEANSEPKLPDVSPSASKVGFISVGEQSNVRDSDALCAVTE